MVRYRTPCWSGHDNAIDTRNVRPLRKHTTVEQHGDLSLSEPTQNLRAIQSVGVPIHCIRVDALREEGGLHAGVTKTLHEKLQSIRKQDGTIHRYKKKISVNVFE